MANPEATVSAREGLGSTNGGEQAPEARSGGTERSRGIQELWVPGHVVPYARTRGATRYKPTSVRVYQEYLTQTVAEELSLLQIPGLPHPGPWYVAVECIFGSEKELRQAGDPDNLLKTILDALTGILWTDDRLRQVRSVSLTSSVGKITGLLLNAHC